MTIPPIPIIFNDSPSTLAQWLTLTEQFFCKSYYDCHEDLAADWLSDLEVYNDDLPPAVADIIGEFAEHCWNTADCEEA